MTAFILQNQHGQFLSKENEWVNSGESCALFRSPHYDVALNHLIEINAKDHSLRGAVVACEVDSKGRPVPGSHNTDQQQSSIAGGSTAEHAPAAADHQPEHNHNVDVVVDNANTALTTTQPILDSIGVAQCESPEESETTAAHA